MDLIDRLVSRLLGEAQPYVYVTVDRDGQEIELCVQYSVSRGMPAARSRFGVPEGPDDPPEFAITAIEPPVELTAEEERAVLDQIQTDYDPLDWIDDPPEREER